MVGGNVDGERDDLRLHVVPDDGAGGIYSPRSLVWPRVLFPGVAADAALPAVDFVLVLFQVTPVSRLFPPFLLVKLYLYRK